MAGTQMVDVNIIGLRGTMGRFARAQEVIPESMAAELGGTLREILQMYREGAPKSPDDAPHEHPDGGTQAYSESFTGNVAKDGSVVNAEVTTTQPLLRTFINEGTAEHDIPTGGAQIGKILAFTWGGDQVFFRSVHHPGTKANAWEDPIVLRASEMLTLAGNRVGTQVVASMAGEGD